VRGLNSVNRTHMNERRVSGVTCNGHTTEMSAELLSARAAISYRKAGQPWHPGPWT
jgi:hypothetical protein